MLFSQFVTASQTLLPVETKTNHMWKQKLKVFFLLMEAKSNIFILLEKTTRGSFTCRNKAKFFCLGKQKIQNIQKNKNDIDCDMSYM